MVAATTEYTLHILHIGLEVAWVSWGSQTASGKNHRHRKSMKAVGKLETRTRDGSPAATPHLSLPLTEF